MIIQPTTRQVIDILQSHPFGGGVPWAAAQQGARRSRGFDPADLDNLALRLQADDGVTTPGGAVATWADQAGSFDHTQATAGQRPTHHNTEPRYVLWDGSDDYLEQNSVVAAGAWSIALKFKMDTLPASGDWANLCSIVQSTTKTFANIELFNAVSGYEEITFLAKASGTVVTARGVNATLDTSEHRLIITYNDGTNTDSASYTATLDGASQSVVASGSVARSSSDKGTLGARATSTGTASKVLNGRIYKFLVYTDVLTAAEIEKVDEWLQ